MVTDVDDILRTLKNLLEAAEPKRRRYFTITRANLERSIEEIECLRAQVETSLPTAMEEIERLRAQVNELRD